MSAASLFVKPTERLSEQAAYDARVHAAIIDALKPTDWLPVSPLIEIVVGYAMSFCGWISTVGPASSEKRDFVNPISVAVVRYGNAAAGGKEAVELTDKNYVVLACVANVHGFLRITIDGYVVPFAGDPKNAGFKSGAARAGSEFRQPVAVRVDPCNANRFYLADTCSVRLLDRTDAKEGGEGVVSVVCGSSAAWGSSDGVGAAAKLHAVCDMIVTGDGATVLVCESDEARIRSVDVNTRAVKTIARRESSYNTWQLTPPRCMAFEAVNRSVPAGAERDAARDAMVVVTTKNGLYRLDRRDGSVRSISLDPKYPLLDPCGVVCVPNGSIVVACGHTSRLYRIDPTNGDVIELPCRDANGVVAGGSGGGGLWTPRGMCLDGESVLVADAQNKAIRRITLAPELFE